MCVCIEQKCVHLLVRHWMRPSVLNLASFIRTRNSRHGEGPSPAHAEEIGIDDEIADDVSQAEAEIDAKLEEGESGTASRGRSQIGDHRRGERNATSLKDTQEETE